ncbi:UNVERIFIED_CONTAM: hypothetical protein GTU68_039303 [Idotea baltica]|nr:hypothetical protein [Idotea baltica]
MKVSLNSISKFYTDAQRELKVIDNLSYDFPENSSIAITGRSGIGKTTLLYLLAGLDNLNSGQILYNDKDIYKLNENELANFRSNKIGFIFQFHNLLGEFTAVENVSIPLILSGMNESQANIQSKEILEYLGLEDRFDHIPSQLSGGEQQRVAIARAIVNEPEVILADEPTGNLDIETASIIEDLLLDLNKKLNSTLIIMTHSMNLAQKMDLVLKMKPGGNLGEVKQ